MCEVRTSYASTPNAKISDFCVIRGTFEGSGLWKALLPGYRTTSGDIYSGVPAKPFNPPTSGLILAASPKSITLMQT